MRRKAVKWLSYLLLGLSVLCIVLVSLVAISNINLPEQSRVVDRLSELEKARLSEALHLQQSLGDTVWPGFGQLDVPLIVYAVILDRIAPGWKDQAFNQDVMLEDLLRQAVLQPER